MADSAGTAVGWDHKNPEENAMAAYVKHGDQIVLALSKGEASALLEIALDGEKAASKVMTNNAVRHARDRALRALEIACEPGSRSGQAIS